MVRFSLFGLCLWTLTMVCLGFILVADMVFVQQSAGWYVLLAMQSGFRFLTSRVLIQNSACHVRNLLEARMGSSCEAALDLCKMVEERMSVILSLIRIFDY